MIFLEFEVLLKVCVVVALKIRHSYSCNRRQSHIIIRSCERAQRTLSNIISAMYYRDVHIMRRYAYTYTFNTHIYTHTLITVSTFACIHVG